MKTPKPVVDHSAAYMDKGATNNNAQNAPKGTGFAESETKPSGHISVGMQQHRRAISKTGDRFAVPHEHMNPTAATFHKIGRG